MDLFVTNESLTDDVQSWSHFLLHSITGFTRATFPDTSRAKNIHSFYSLPRHHSPSVALEGFGKCSCSILPNQSRNCWEFLADFLWKLTRSDARSTRVPAVRITSRESAHEVLPNTCHDAAAGATGLPR